MNRVQYLPENTSQILQVLTTAFIFNNSHINLTFLDFLFEGFDETSAVVDQWSHHLGKASCPITATSMAPATIQLEPCYPDRDEDVDEYLIFFITGNPGLIGYYDIFLNILHDRLQSSAESSGRVFHIYGRSLAGFEDHAIPLEVDDDGSGHYKSLESGRGQAPYSLQQEIDIIWNTLSKQRIRGGRCEVPERHPLIPLIHSSTHYFGSRIPQETLTTPSAVSRIEKLIPMMWHRKRGQQFTGTILIGHSVGSYILLELLRLSKLEPENMNILSGICLFPTVTHISKSPSGLKFSVLCQIPGFPRIASSLAKLLLLPIPRIVVKFLVRLITRMPDAAAETTTDFLGSKMGIYQALWVIASCIDRDRCSNCSADTWLETRWRRSPKTNGMRNCGESKIPRLTMYRSSFSTSVNMYGFSWCGDPSTVTDF